MATRDFEINGKKFKSRKLDATKQFHIVRRVTPILGDMVPAIQKLVKEKGDLENLTEDQKFEKIVPVVMPVVLGLSKLSDQDSEYVLFGLLAAIEMEQAGGGWAPICQGTMIMFQDLDLPVLLRIAAQAFSYNLSGFFSALPPQSQASRELQQKGL